MGRRSKGTQGTGGDSEPRLGGRTTISLGPDLAQRLSKYATASGFSVMEAVRQAVEGFVEFHEAILEQGQNGPTDQAIRIAKTSRRLPNFYQGRFGQWRLSRTERLIGDLTGFRVDLEAWPAEIYLLRILTELMQTLDGEDELLIVSNRRFWADPASEGGLGSGFTSVYLNAQEEAIKRGLKLHRVFLLAPSEVTDSALDSHRSFLGRVPRENRDSVRIEYRVFDDVEQARMQFGHFAAVCRPNGDCMVIEPVYYGSTRNINMRLLFSRGPWSRDPAIKFYIDRFSQSAVGARSILDTKTQP